MIIIIFKLHLDSNKITGYQNVVLYEFYARCGCCEMHILMLYVVDYGFGE